MERKVVGARKKIFVEIYVILEVQRVEPRSRRSKQISKGGGRRGITQVDTFWKYWMLAGAWQHLRRHHSAQILQ